MTLTTAVSIGRTLRYDRLQRDGDMARGHDRIDCCVGTGPVGAAAGDGDVEISAACHHRARADLELAYGQPRPVVHPKDRVAGKAVEKAVGNHRGAAAKPLFGRLKDQMNRPVEIACLSQIAGGAEQHRRMPVMSTGMHAAVIAGAIGKIVRLLDRQAVHVGPQPERAFRIAGAQPPDNAGFADTGEHLPAELAEPAGDKIGGPVFFESEFRMGVDVSPPFRQIVMKLTDALDDLHVPLPTRLP